MTLMYSVNNSLVPGVYTCRFVSFFNADEVAGNYL